MKISFHCKKCRKGLRTEYETCGCPDDIVLKGITMRCKTCTRVITPKNYTERHIVDGAKDGKYFI
ncbi:hypothetical protein SAMN02910400_01054 [Lachnospiraceae bacterium C10]|nr:hypothetical protein SAMN02910400_01054 [Lachnospiraceae bacterium C10]